MHLARKKYERSVRICSARAHTLLAGLLTIDGGLSKELAQGHVCAARDVRGPGAHGRDVDRGSAVRWPEIRSHYQPAGKLVLAEPTAWEQQKDGYFEICRSRLAMCWRCIVHLDRSCGRVWPGGGYGRRLRRAVWRWQDLMPQPECLLLSLLRGRVRKRAVAWE